LPRDFFLLNAGLASVMPPPGAKNHLQVCSPTYFL
jgi:hypothetical protein